MSGFWVGVIWASGFWGVVYLVAVLAMAFREHYERAGEMMNTEAANDRVSKRDLLISGLESDGKSGFHHIKEILRTHP